MAMGRCSYMVCDSMLGSSWRGMVFELLPDLRWRNRTIDEPVCPPHERILDEAKKRNDRINLSAEGWLYLESWVVAPLFVTWG